MKNSYEISLESSPKENFFIINEYLKKIHFEKINFENFNKNTKIPVKILN